MSMKLRHFYSYASMVVCLYLLSHLLVGCNKKREPLSPFGWTSTGLHSDSLLIRADSALMSYADPDILENIVNEYCKISEKEDTYNVYEHRRLYWKGNVRFMHGDYETGDSLRRLALEKCDSSVFPRDYRLYRMAIEQPSDFPDNASRYRRYKDDLDLFLRSGDLVSGFTRSVQLSGLMSEAGMTKEALEYALLSDSLLARTSLSTLRTNNRVNIASAYAAVGDTVRAEQELRTVRDSDKSYSNPSISAIVDYNLFELSGDTALLYNAWTTVNRFEELAKMRPLVASSIISSGYLKSTKQLDLKEALDLYSYYDYSPAELLEITRARLVTAKISGNIETIKVTTEEYMNAVRNYIDSQHKGEIIAAETSQEIKEVEDREKSISESLRTRIWIGIITGIFILASVGIIVFRYVERQKRCALLNQLESERLHRDIMAKELMLVEKQKLNDTLQRKIEDFVNAKRIEKKTAQAISNIIESTDGKSPIAQEETEFLKSFIEKYPGVSKTGRKIALLIWKGLDTADIAKEMNIRKESVMQARWRLRNQMDLSSDSDLDVELRKC